MGSASLHPRPLIRPPPQRPSQRARCGWVQRSVTHHLRRPRSKKDGLRCAAPILSFNDLRLARIGVGGRLRRSECHRCAVIPGGGGARGTHGGPIAAYAAFHSPSAGRRGWVEHSAAHESPGPRSKNDVLRCRALILDLPDHGRSRSAQPSFSAAQPSNSNGFTAAERWMPPESPVNNQSRSTDRAPAEDSECPAVRVLTMKTVATSPLPIRHPPHETHCYRHARSYW